MSAGGKFKYVEVAGTLRGRIESGELAAGTKLVMSRLAKEYGVSPGTVFGALNDLERGNLVHVERHGWYVGAEETPRVPPRPGAGEDSGDVGDSGTPPPVNLLGLLDLGQGASLLARADASARRVARELYPPDATLAQRIALYDFLHKISSEVRWPHK